MFEHEEKFEHAQNKSRKSLALIRESDTIKLSVNLGFVIFKKEIFILSGGF